jgi:hypothetical protein
MLLWFLSKVFISVAAVALIALTISFFMMEREVYADIELQNTVDIIGDTINEVSSIHGNVTVTITFDKDVEGVFLPTKIMGKPYEITVYRDIVVLTRDTTQVSSRFISSVHCWKPSPTEKLEWTSMELMEQDLSNYYLELSSGQDLFVEQRLLLVDGEYQYHTFVYPAY